MRNGSGSRRQRNRGGNRRPSNNRMQVFDSNGPEVRIRGTAHQVAEKYVNLAKDAASAGDRILAESYLQHAEHYQRIISAWDEEDRSSRTYDNNTQAQDVHDDEDDLSLPNSILGGNAQASSQANVERTLQMAAE